MIKVFVIFCFIRSVTGLGTREFGTKRTLSR